MTKGGYQVISLNGIQLEIGVAQTFEGIYEKIEGTRKAILVSGLNIAGTEYHDTFVDFTVSGSDFTSTIYGKTITITSEDRVTITA